MKSPADILRSLPIVQRIIARHNFDPVAVIKDVPSYKYESAISYLYSENMSGRWNAQKDHESGTYTFTFEYKEDALNFKMII